MGVALASSQHPPKVSPRHSNHQLRHRKIQKPSNTQPSRLAPSYTTRRRSSNHHPPQESTNTASRLPAQDTATHPCKHSRRRTAPELLIQKVNRDDVKQRTTQAHRFHQSPPQSTRSSRSGRLRCCWSGDQSMTRLIQIPCHRTSCSRFSSADKHSICPSRGWTRRQYESPQGIRRPPRNLDLLANTRVQSNPKQLAGFPRLWRSVIALQVDNC